MKVKRIVAVYFSPTGNTKKVVSMVTKEIAEKLHIKVLEDDFTLPKQREKKRIYGQDELVVFGVPTYAGRVPNKVLPWIQELFSGNTTVAVPVVTFGNRSYDDALLELKLTLEKQGFLCIAAGAFVSEHVFSKILAQGRPNLEDIQEIISFSQNIAYNMQKEKEITSIHLERNGKVGPYYTPLKEDQSPAKFLKAKPKTTQELCNHCNRCVHVCPMGSIAKEYPENVVGICIKCQACVRICPTHAKYFDDENFISHVRMLEKNYQRKAKNAKFIIGKGEYL